MDKHLDAFIEEFGAPTTSIPADDAVLQRFDGRLPNILVDYWMRLGFSGFANGLFWLTNPDEYEDALEEWIGDTPIVEEDAYYVVGRSAFGDLYLWGEKNGYKYVVNARQGWILQKDGYRQKIATAGADAAMRTFVAIMSRERCDMNAVDRKPLFDRAVSKLGSLAPDEVFAFEPSLIVGGEPELKNIAKRNIHVHLSILAQFGQREILDRVALTKKAFG